VYLIVARSALLVLSFRRIAPFCLRRPRRAEPLPPRRDQAIRDVRWAIGAAGARLPGATVCFPRALAAQAMLRRRGIPTTLTYGARTRNAQFEAHVWLTAGDVGVVGHELAAEYVTLATSSSAPVQESRA
jgi:hypothetical protein